MYHPGTQGLYEVMAFFKHQSDYVDGISERDEKEWHM